MTIKSTNLTTLYKTELLRYWETVKHRRYGEAYEQKLLETWRECAKNGGQAMAYREALRVIEK